jgi:CRP-like cAMP-binding protein
MAELRNEFPKNHYLRLLGCLQLELIGKLETVVKFGKEVNIHSLGDFGDKFYILLSGLVLVLTP